MAGLQDISPIVSLRWVSSSVRAPARAAAEAASQPAWPPPITITSNVLISRCIRVSDRPNKPSAVSLFHVKQNSLAEAKVPEDHIQQLVEVDAAGEPADLAERQPQVLRCQLRRRGFEGAPASAVSACSTACRCRARVSSGASPQSIRVRAYSASRSMSCATPSPVLAETQSPEAARFPTRSALLQTSMSPRSPPSCASADPSSTNSRRSAAAALARARRTPSSSIGIAGFAQSCRIG